MPISNDEAIAELQKLLDDDERSYAWLGRRLGESRMWVSNRMRKVVSLGYEDYTRMLHVLAPERFSEK